MRRTIHPYLRVSADCRDHNVDSAVAIEVAKGTAAMPCRRGSRKSRFACQSLPLATRSRIAKDGVVLIHCERRFRHRFHMAARYKQVFPAIVVEIEEAGAISGHRSRQLAQSRGKSHLFETFAALIPEQRKSLIVECDENNVGIPVIVIIAKIQTH